MKKILVLACPVRNIFERHELPDTGSPGFYLLSSDSASCPPSGWMSVTSGAGNGINIVGIPNRQGGPNPHMPTAMFSKPGGIGISSGDPTFWLSGSTEPINISNLHGGGGARFILIGQCSNGDRTGSGVVNNVVF